MNLNTLRNTANRPNAITALSVFAVSVGLSACSGIKTTYKPIKVPKNAEYLGINDNDSGEYTDGGGKSYIVYLEDTDTISCGHEQHTLELGADGHYSPSKEIRVLQDGDKAQVTCHGAGSDFPETYYPSAHREPDAAADIGTAPQAGGVLAP